MLLLGASQNKGRGRADPFIFRTSRKRSAARVAEMVIAMDDVALEGCAHTHTPLLYLYTNMTDDTTTDDTRRSEKGIATPSQPGDRYYCTPPAHSTVRHTLRHTLRHLTHPVASRGLGVHSAVVVVPSRASNAVCAPPAEHSHHRCAGKGMPVAVADRGALPVQGLAHQPLVDQNKRGVEYMRMSPTIAWRVGGNDRDARIQEFLV